MSRSKDRWGVYGVAPGTRVEVFKFEVGPMIVCYSGVSVIGFDATIECSTVRALPHSTRVYFDLPAVPTGLIAVLRKAMVPDTPLPTDTVFTLDCGAGPVATVDATGAFVNSLSVLDDGNRRTSFAIVAQGHGLRACLPWPVRG